MTWEVNPIWRLNEEFSVVHAAILLAGGSPDHAVSGWIEEGTLHYNHDGYNGALEALKSAIRSGSFRRERRPSIYHCRNGRDRAQAP